MVPKNGNGEKTTDKRFWLSVGGLLFAILGTWMALSDKVTENSTNIERNQDAIEDLQENINRRCDKIEGVVNLILMELRK